MNVKEELTYFINKNISYYDYFKKCQSPNLINIYEEKGDYELIKIINARLIKQKNLHKLFREELSKLNKFSMESGLFVIGLKGVFLEDYLYKNSEFCRFYSDIDLLIKNDEKNNIAKYFIKDKEFSLYDDKQLIYNKIFKVFTSNIKNMLRINIDTKNHIVLYKKSEGVNLYIELHSNFNILRLSNFDHDKLIANKKLITLQNNEKIFTLGDTDNLLFLCHHMIRHLPYVYNDSLGPIHINIDKVLDIALLINRNDNILRVILPESDKYNITPYVALALYITKGVFPSLIDNSIVEELIEESKKRIFPWKKIFICLIKLKPIDILSGNIEKELPELMHAVEYIEKFFGPFEEYTMFRNIKMMVWKNALKNYKF